MQSSLPPTHSPPPRRLCLFGGSFDPVHLGHTTLAAAAHRQAHLEKIIFLPARQSPHKQNLPAPASAHHRVAMLRLALHSLPWAELSTWELDQPGPSYSWQTATHFASMEKSQSDLCWLLGADQWSMLHTWARPEILAKTLTFLVFPRADTPILPRPGFKHEIVDCRHPASSTAARAASQHRHSLEHIVAPDVARYIQSHGLYR